MATKSIIKNIEISDPAEAEKLVKALEEAKKICRRTGRSTKNNRKTNLYCMNGV